MFEQDGTTPASQDSTTPALTIEELQAKVELLENNLAFANSRVESVTQTLAQANQRISDEMDKVGNLESKIYKAEQAFKEILAGDIDASEIVDTYGQIFADHFGWEFTREVKIEINVTWRGTIELPYGVDVDDLDIDDFGIDNPDHNEYQTSELNYGMHDYSIEER